MRKVTILALVSFALVLSGCIDDEKFSKRKGKHANEVMNEICYDGIIYIQSTTHAGYTGYGYMSVKFTQDSKVQKCTH